MAKVHETLRKKSDLSIEVYPNIENENIPTGVVTGDKLATNTISTGKLANGCVTTNKLDANAVIESKIANGSISTGKIIDNAVTNDKLASNSVGTSNIINDSITQDKIQAGAVGSTEIQSSAITLEKLSLDLWQFYKDVSHTKMIYIANDDETSELFIGTFVYDEEIDEYTEEDIKNAIDFDKASSSDYTSTDLTILNYIIEKSNKQFITNHGTTYTRLYTADEKYQFIMGSATATENVIRMDDLSTSTTLFELQWNKETNVITSYINTNYIYLYFYDLFGSGNWE